MKEGITINTLNKDRKIQILESILSTLRDWDGTSESAVGIIASNEPYFTQLKSMEQEESAEDKEALIEIHQKIVVEQKKLMFHIKQERTKLKSQLNQVSKKGKVVKNYMSMKNHSIFVDRNL